jgi:hypothetical protein
VTFEVVGDGKVGVIEPQNKLRVFGTSKLETDMLLYKEN